MCDLGNDFCIPYNSQYLWWHVGAEWSYAPCLQSMFIFQWFFGWQSKKSLRKTWLWTVHCAGLKLQTEWQLQLCQLEIHIGNFLCGQATELQGLMYLQCKLIELIVWIAWFFEVDFFKFQAPRCLHPYLWDVLPNLCWPGWRVSWTYVAFGQKNSYESIAFQCWKIWRFLFGLTRWVDVCVAYQRNPSQYFGDTGLSVFVSPVSAVRVAYRVLESSSGLVAAPGSGRWSKMVRCDSNIGENSFNHQRV